MAVKRLFAEERSRQEDWLGYGSYKQYLLSPEWKAIRAAVLTARPKCEVCGTYARQVHHHSYHWLVMNGSMSEMLVSICNGCHYEIEFEKGFKLPQKAVAEKLIRILGAVGKRSTKARLMKWQKIVDDLYLSNPRTRAKMKAAIEKSTGRKIPPRPRVKKKRFH